MKRLHTLALFASIGLALAAPASEQDALAILASDSSVEQKASACQELAIHGNEKSVPALAALLFDEQLASYARTALEVIDHPSAGNALRNALPKLDGRLQAGVATSLGVRRDKAAIPALKKLSSNSNLQVASASLYALAHIRTSSATNAILKILATGPQTIRLPAAQAALTAADALAEQGDRKAARKLAQAILKADLPAHIHKAATGLLPEIES